MRPTPRGQYSKTDQEIDEFYGSGAEQRGAASQHAALVSYLESIDKASEMPLEESIPLLAGMLRKLCKKNIFQVPERVEVYDKARKGLLSIPGHAEYFANQMDKERKASQDFVANRQYHEACETLRDTLRHMPSPETVQVLGGMLESMEDDPSQEQRIEMAKLQWSGSYHKWFFPSGLGASTLHALEIRGFPPGQGRDGSYLGTEMPSIRKWWEKVKSGSQSFSFKGQEVEYRFNPDGTWETIAIANPPDDPREELKTGTVQRPEKRALPELPAPQVEPASRVWFWFAGMGAVLIALLVWFVVRRRSA